MMVSQGEKEKWVWLVLESKGKDYQVPFSGHSVKSHFDLNEPIGLALKHGRTFFAILCMEKWGLCAPIPWI